MPKPIKKRIVKKITIQEDEVKSALMHTLDAANERKKHLIIALAAVVGLIAIYIIFSVYSASSKEKAYALETDAYKYYYGIDIKENLTEKERWGKALELYKKSVDIKATPTARFYLGNCYYNLGDFDNAIKEYTVFIDNFRSQKEILPVVYQKLASAYLKKNNNAKAIETLDKLAQLNNGIFKDTALALEARHYETAGDSGKAMEKYKELVKLFPSSSWSAEAKSKIPKEDEAKKPADKKDK
ncbi:MAG: tetratricopeptide repeat protein [Nitrospirae bacterium]|nr:tetratricopeptide repeat protein [Nitrospirota bacterium]